eukprot:353775-Chlamydomonas_euryale.AAC.4
MSTNTPSLLLLRLDGADASCASPPLLPASAPLILLEEAGFNGPTDSDRSTPAGARPMTAPAVALGLKADLRRPSRPCVRKSRWSGGVCACRGEGFVCMRPRYVRMRPRRALVAHASASCATTCGWF